MLILEPISDSVITISYFIISVQLIYYAKKNNLSGSFNRWLFIFFIFFCGATHFLDIIFHFDLSNRTPLIISKILTAIVSGLCVIYSFREFIIIAKLQSKVDNLTKQILLVNSYIFHDVRVCLNTATLASRKIKKSTNKIALTESLQHANEIINNILDINNIHTDTFVVYRSFHSITKFIEKFKNTFNIIAKEADINLKINIASYLKNKSINVDFTKLLQGINNLVSNAVKHTPKRGDITITIYTESDYIIFSVKDTGKGMTKEQIDRLFEPFGKIDNTTYGSGLGLFITQEIAKKHDGRVTVNSVIGQGTTFNLIIKAIIIEEDLTEVNKVKKEKINVLVVEDDNYSNYLLSEYLENKDFSVIRCYNGKECLELLKEDTDLIFIDTYMPVMNGPTAVEKIRKFGYSKCKIVALTGSTQEIWKEIQINYFLHKPIDFGLLDDILKEFK